MSNHHPAVLQQKYRDFQLLLEALSDAPDVFADLPRRMAYSGDASFYYLLPQLVVRAHNLQQVVAVLQRASEMQIAVTFRAAGTSLSGQAISDSVLLLLSDHWQAARVIDDGAKIWLQAGVIGAKANQLLQPYGRKIGPDPASINSCKVGGIAANNASGMCCGVKHNSYHTVQDMTLVLADGTVLDTSCPKSVADFQLRNRQLLDALQALAAEVNANEALQNRIRHKYRLKNTTGYGLNALVDYTNPLDILKHLMIGSEGTLGFIADITYQTVPQDPYRATGFFVFDSLQACCESVSLLSSCPVEAVELLDFRALQSVADKPGMPDIASLPANAAALLIEVAATTEELLQQHIKAVNNVLSAYRPSLVAEVVFSRDASRNAALWNIRKGTFPAVGAVRATGTTVIIEDVAFPIERLAEGVAALQRLFSRYGYDEAIIFGHALEGNLHFVFTQAFDTGQQKQRYADFMAEVSQMVAVDFQGSLKAEHGTGRNMAPFVALEWGDDAYQIMRRIKQLFDPLGILNPGVILNTDANAHLANLKMLPAVDGIIDKCIECGFCEAVCPSQEFSLTPRQRIAMQRQMQALAGTELTEARAAYQHAGIDSCAATGLCASRCPVGINTGDYIKTLRAAAKPVPKVAVWAANHFSAASQLARFALNSAGVARNMLGVAAVGAASRGLRRFAPALPYYYGAWPSGASKVKLPAATASQLTPVLYFPSCANRIFSPDRQAADPRDIPTVLSIVLQRAGFQLLVPDKLNDLCCGQPWDSKGWRELAERKRSQTIQQLQQAMPAKPLMVITDAAPCALQLQAGQPDFELFELAEFLYQKALPALTINKQTEPVVLHVTCSTQRRGSADQLVALTKACAEQVVIPADIDCCGFAGDKGFTLPGLNAHALRTLKQQIPSGCQRGYSNSRTCEIGLTEHSGLPYQSILYLLEEVSR
ncbi:FAD-binding and (Fe-S)-binding domain-containing protein [Alkalimonas mucilaginosa]|uniref:D-lactate dehydrogenase (cytochrome) n=1 Tax=Alkalimonas mucilaginosa TaxID=3057676 RepID=A0ABU7JHX5_9GAMM|nr:FAD-binding and (Fe-S)-binding domain-containing protein [Alkalimonas sp. MEB004]MEE2025267.1 FAD-binding and (Fe-S)-binding domain-containing protein [Alkalimonas sp. MEB004]